MRPDLNISPLEYPWGGVALHGNTPFSCALMTKMDDRLYLGGCIDGLMLPLEIEFVVSLYPWETYRPNGKVKGELSIQLLDAAMDAPELFILAADAVREFSSRGPTLVHCQAGLNRSGTVLALHLIRDRGMSAEEALAWMREKRSPAVVCNAEFEAWLIGYAAAHKEAGA